MSRNIAAERQTDRQTDFPAGFPFGLSSRRQKKSPPKRGLFLSLGNLVDYPACASVRCSHCYLYTVEFEHEDVLIGSHINFFWTVCIEQVSGELFECHRV